MNITIKEKGETMLNTKPVTTGLFHHQNHLWLWPELQLERIYQGRRWQMKDLCRSCSPEGAFNT
ncbi:hypothetical protein [Desulforhopalus sp. IMCC35007]|uniref:hypothetical protein n=1 Tax=Desulforhopalus sp. IMCC35007 TaxID=2569543 RepID=UPI0010ADFF43|nr:hypothetical protein [Desulforhopalus sp. IMCC35007]TKB12341.1 hypothetical protein FCL48_01440 [Desulforhopalus sp. IMCC35007]